MLDLVTSYSKPNFSLLLSTQAAHWQYLKHIWKGKLWEDAGT